MNKAVEHFETYHETVGEKIDRISEWLNGAVADIREANYGKAQDKIKAALGANTHLAQAWDMIENLRTK